MELRRNWHKFRSLLGSAPARNNGITLLSFQGKIVDGSISGKQDQEREPFRDVNLPLDDMNSAFEQLSMRYKARTMTVIQRDDLLKVVNEMHTQNSSSRNENSYISQLMHIRNALGIDQPHRDSLAKFWGEGHIKNSFPRPHFVLQMFRSWFADLLPERKLIFLGVLDEEKGSLDSMLLEFDGNKLKRFWEPDWAGFDWKAHTQTFVNRESAAKFVSWCENRYVLPCYAIFVSKECWNQCIDLQDNQSNRAAWKFFVKKRNGKPIEREVVIEPEPWPLKALLYWNSIRS